MFSLRETRIISFILLSFLIAFMAVFYYVAQSNIAGKLNNIINLENERIHSWFRLSQLANEAKSDFYKIIMEHNPDINEIMSDVELWNKELEKLKNSPYEIDRNNIAHLKRVERMFKSAVFGYKREVESGYYGTSALDFEKIALTAANRISDFSYLSAEDVFKFVNQRNLNILREFKKSNNILIFTFFLGVILAAIIIFILGITVNRAMRLFITGMNHLAVGDLDYRIGGKLDKDVEKLALIFNNMMNDLKNSEGKIQKIYKVLDKVTSNVDEGIMLLSKDLKIVWVNKKIGEFFGGKDPEIIGKYCYNIIHNSVYPCGDQDKCPFKKTYESKQVSSIVQTLHNQKGESFYAETILFPLIGEAGGIEEYIYIIRNISERIILEKKMENNISALTTARLDLEKRMRELEKVHKITINRELRMVELKKRLTQLESASSKRS